MLLTHFLEDHLHNYVLKITQLRDDRLEFKILKLSKKPEEDRTSIHKSGHRLEKLLISPMHS